MYFVLSWPVGSHHLLGKSEKRRVRKSYSNEVCLNTGALDGGRGMSHVEFENIIDDVVFPLNYVLSYRTSL